MDARVIDCLSDAFCVYGAIAFVSDLPQSGGRFIVRTVKCLTTQFGGGTKNGHTGTSLPFASLPAA